MTNTITSRTDWLVARKSLLQREKDFNIARDALSAERRDLPWVKIDKDYIFDGENGPETLSDMFNGKRQLIIYHFMFGADAQTGCPSCSFWIDNFEGVQSHLNARDTTLALVSKAPLETLLEFRDRMGWTLPWLSAAKTDFNEDFNVSFPADTAPKSAPYNFDSTKVGAGEMPGASVFIKGDDGEIYHSYSTYSRGLDMFNGAYQLLDLTPQGRDEAKLPWSMSWVRRHNEYNDAAP